MADRRSAGESRVLVGPEPPETPAPARPRTFAGSSVRRCGRASAPRVARALARPSFAAASAAERSGGPRARGRGRSPPRCCSPGSPRGVGRSSSATRARKPSAGLRPSRRYRRRRRRYRASTLAAPTTTRRRCPHGRLPWSVRHAALQVRCIIDGVDLDVRLYAPGSAAGAYPSASGARGPPGLGPARVRARRARRARVVDRRVADRRGRALPVPVRAGPRRDVVDARRPARRTRSRPTATSPALFSWWRAHPSE